MIIYMKSDGTFGRADAQSVAGFPSGAISVSGVEIDFLKAEKKLLTKEVARQKILAILPAWKQSNMAARSIELVEKKVDGAITAEELTELAYMKNIWSTVITPIRDASNLIDASIATMLGIDDVKAYNPWKSVLWP